MAAIKNSNFPPPPISRVLFNLVTCRQSDRAESPARAKASGGSVAYADLRGAEALTLVKRPETFLIYEF